MKISNQLSAQFKEYNKVFNEININEYEKFIKKLKILRLKK